MVKLDVVRRCAARHKPDRFADHKRNGLGLGLAHGLGGCRPALGLVQHFVRGFVDKGRKLLGLGLPVPNEYPSSRTRTQCAIEVVTVEELNALDFEEGGEALDVLAGVT